MLGTQFDERAVKGSVSAQPFVDHYAERILVAGRARLALDLFGRHVGDCAHYVLGALVAQALGDEGNAKVAQQHGVILSNKHVFWLDVAMNELFIMGILQCIGDLSDVRDNRGQGQKRSTGMALAQGATCGIVHDQEGCLAVQAEFDTRTMCGWTRRATVWASLRKLSRSSAAASFM
jgi:hypothetical protein